MFQLHTLQLVTEGRHSVVLGVGVVVGGDASVIAGVVAGVGLVADVGLVAGIGLVAEVGVVADVADFVGLGVIGLEWIGLD